MTDQLFDKHLPLEYYQNKDVVALAKDLLGKVLVTEREGVRTVGRITETEAYAHIGDKACHSHLRKTGRNQIMFQPGGLAYVYVSYGIHLLFNIVTNTEGNADAVLIRAAEPLEGETAMLLRRGLDKLAPNVSAGPGNLTKAFGIQKDDYGLALATEALYIADDGYKPAPDDVRAGPRVGIGSAGAHALLPWRFSLKSSRYVSKPLVAKYPEIEKGMQ
jgi:DNA-3-methyladenine glycosylase